VKGTGQPQHYATSRERIPGRSTPDASRREIFRSKPRRPTANQLMAFLGGAFELLGSVDLGEVTSVLIEQFENLIEMGASQECLLGDR
jgi:hypothetical protein